MCSILVFSWTTVHVHLIMAKNDHHAKHIDGFFGTAKISHLEKLASMLGSNEMWFVSQNDKVGDTIRMTAAKF